MLTSNVVIWSPLLNCLVPFRLPSRPIEAGCNWLELPLVVREQFRRLVGYVIFTVQLIVYSFEKSFQQLVMYPWLLMWSYMEDGRN